MTGVITSPAAQTNPDQTTIGFADWADGGNVDTAPEAIGDRMSSPLTIAQDRAADDPKPLPIAQY
jgi:hypothetical protein